MSSTIRRISVRGAHVLFAPLFNRFFIDGAIVPQGIDFLLCLRGEEVCHQVLELIQLRLRVDVLQGIQ